jgi:hypothetical protein
MEKDLGATVAEMVYGQSLRLPGEFLTPRTTDEASTDAASFVCQLRTSFEDLRPNSVERYGVRKVFIFKDLATASHVFLRNDGPKRLLQQPYSGPHRIVHRGEKVFFISVNG